MKPDADTLTAYALGLLDGEELRDVEAYLELHPDEAARVWDDHEALAQLILDLPPEPVPAGGEERLIARLREEQAAEPSPIRVQAPFTIGGPADLVAPPASPAAAPRRPWALWTAGLAAAVALALVLAWPGLQGWQTRQTLRAYQQQPGAVTKQLQAQSGEALGTLVRLPDGRTFAVLNQAPRTGRVYQAWSVAGGKALSLGVFEGRHILTPPLQQGAAFAVSVEPPGGSPQPTSAPILVQQL